MDLLTCTFQFKGKKKYEGSHEVELTQAQEMLLSTDLISEKNYNSSF